ncbi:putative type III secretion system effector protein [Yersinia massiliensis]|uniref:type III secretion system translocon subunit SctE n=1 Tax=Yersinia massiliensis TaxID=419257 RepID=UPI0005DEBCA9|nr:type III secretion system translocon subunit SctE [Yersinia massiliensis]CNH38460.1 putative type III secretion system effector protein [Yersinia massiliensis]
MVNATQTSNERINNIRTFTQGVNINQVRDETTKNLLALEDACRELASNEQERRHRQEGSPLLAAPKISLSQAYLMANTPEKPKEGATNRTEGKNQQSFETKGFNASASLFESIATLRQLLHSNNLSELRGRLQLINAESSALRQQGDKLLSALEQGLNDLQAATDKVETCNQAWQQGKDTVLSLTQQQQLLETQLSSSKLILSKSNVLTPESGQKLATDSLNTQATNTQTTQSQNKLIPEGSNKPLPENSHKLTTEQTAQLQAKITMLESGLAALVDKLSEANRNVLALESNHNLAFTQATSIAQQANTSRMEINKFIENAPRPPQVEGERWESSLALLTLLTAQLKKAMNEDSIKSMRQQQEVMEAINEASRKDSEKKAKEAEEAQRKADEANKAASCASKIFGYIMLAVSVIATVASLGTAGPLMIAVAAIGLAMTIADIVLEETGNSSLMGMLAAEISTVATNMLIAFGVPEEQAKEIGSVVGMVLAAVAFLALSLVSMSSFAKNAGQVAINASKQVLTNVVKSAVKALPRELTNALSKIGNKTSNLTKNLTKFSETTARKIELGLNGTNMALGVTNAAVSGGLNLHASALIRDMKELLANMLRNNTAIQAIDELLKALIKSMGQGYDQINEMFEGMLTALNESGHTKANMMKSSFA